MDPRQSRDVVVALLDRLPDSWFRRLRQLAQTARPTGPKRRVLDGLVGISRHRRLPVEVFDVAIAPAVRLEATDSLVAKLLYWHGTAGYEGAEAEYWRRACRRASSVLELGANIGYYSVIGAVANPDCRYRSVEPHPGSAAAIRRNLALNAVTNVEVIEAAAVGRVDSPRLELSIPAQDRYELPAGAFLRDGGEGVDHLRSRQMFTVDAVAVCDLLDGVDLLKIDIEGHEADVLEPVVDDLLRTQPTLFLEVRLAEVPRLREIIVRFATSGYLVFAIGESSLHLVTADQLAGEARLPRYGSKDLVLVPAARAPDL